MLGGDIVVFVFMFYSCFLFRIWYIDFNLYYEVIHGICLFILCFVKSRSLLCFTYIFHTCIYLFI